MKVFKTLTAHAAAFALATSMGCHTPDAFQESGILRVRRIEFVGEAGEGLGLIGITDEGRATIILRDSKRGRFSVLFGEVSTSMSIESPREPRNKITVTAHDDLPMINIWDDTGRLRINLTAETGRSLIQVFDKQKQERAQVIVEEAGATRIILHDAEGKETLRLPGK